MIAMGSATAMIGIFADIFIFFNQYCFFPIRFDYFYINNEC